MWPFNRSLRSAAWAADAMPKAVQDSPGSREEKAKTLDEYTAERVALLQAARGVYVGELAALRTAVAAACIWRIANDVAALPLLTMKRQPGGKAVEAAETREYDLLFRRPNPRHTAFEFRQMMTAQAVLRGNAFAVKQRDRTGRVVRLWPLAKSEVSVVQDGVDLLYHVSAYQGALSGIYTSADMLHLRGQSFAGLEALDRLDTAQDTLALSVSAERAQANAFKNGVRMPGYWSTDQSMGDNVEVIQERLTKMTAGNNQYKSPLLDLGLKWEPAAMSFDDAQMIETRKHQIVEVCAQYNVLPAVLGLDDKTQAYGSVEAMMRGHLQHTLRPWLTAWEQVLDRDVLDGAEGPLFAKFDTNEFEKASAREQAEAFKTLVGLTIMTPNEARAKLGLAAAPWGDEPLRPLNMSTGQESEDGDDA